MTAIATAAPPRSAREPSEIPPGCVVLRDVSWEFYESFLEETAEQRVRHAYDGNLTIMAPIGLGHESPKKRLAQLVEALTETWNVFRKSVGSLTLRSALKKCGAEPDEGYYLRANEALMRRRNTYDPEVDPPPDLLIEIDMTSPSFYRLPIYAALGVPEVWRWDGETLEVHRLADDETYEITTSSGHFPSLPMDEIAKWLERANETDESTWIRRFREWAASIRPQPEDAGA
jgi:Uma2 family endonuclease